MKNYTNKLEDILPPLPTLYLVDGMEVLVVEVPEEPEHPGTKDLSEKHHEGSEIEDEDHSSQPMEEHDRPYRGWSLGQGHTRLMVHVIIVTIIDTCTCMLGVPSLIVAMH